MTFHLFSVVLLLCATLLHCALNKCTNEQTCVSINKCPEWCARIEDIGGVSNLSENEKAQFRKSICGFKKDDIMLCCEAHSESPECSIRRKPKPKNTLVHSCGKIKVNGSYSPPFQSNFKVEGSQYIAGGEEVTLPGMWPWMARLIFNRNDTFPDLDRIILLVFQE